MAVAFTSSRRAFPYESQDLKKQREQGTTRHQGMSVLPMPLTTVPKLRRHAWRSGPRFVLGIFETATV
jgi:hypothetical protein